MEAQNGGRENQLSIQDFLRKRDEIDRAIEEKFLRPITVMFTDITASTDFFETHGDLQGRAMVQRHNDILYPIIEKHGGRVIKPLGDGLMVSFEDPPNAARAAIEIQKKLAGINEGKPPVNQIWVKISIHYDKGIVEEGDVYGDVVNTSARINSLSKKGQILVSQAYIDVIKQEPDIGYDYVGAKTLKGKAVPVDIHRIIWDPAQEADLRRSIDKGIGEAKAVDVSGDQQILWLDFSLEGDRIKLIAYRKGEQDQTVRHVKEYPYQEKEIRALLDQMNRCLTTVDERGKSSRENFVRFRELSNHLYKLLVPEDAEKFFSASPAHTLVLQLDDRLVYIPWELLHNGEQFLCLRYVMGRLVSTSQEVFAQSRDLTERPLRMLVIANPRGDLPATDVEGSMIEKEFKGNRNLLNVDLYHQKTPCEFLQTRLADYDLFHYAGHSDYDETNPSRSGLLLTDGKFESGRLLEIAHQKPLPSLVFTNACQSSRTENWRSREQLYGLANAFLMSGVRHYIGSTMDLFDRSGAAFAQEFYARLIKDRSVGEALRQARLKSVARYGEENFTWAFYVLYGDPSFRYFGEGEITVRESEKISSKPHLKMLAVLAMVLFLILGALLGKSLRFESSSTMNLVEEGFSLIRQGQTAKAEEVFRSLKGKTPLYPQGMFTVYLNRGDLRQAEDMLPMMQSNQTDSVYLSIARAHLALAEGNFKEAETGYRSIIEDAKTNHWQRAEAYFGLGRVLFNTGTFPQAVEAFDRALALDSSFLQAYTAKGLALERMGKPREALVHYQKAAAVNPNDSISVLLYRKTKEQLDLEKKAEQRKRLDALVSELVGAYREGRGAAQPADEWTSRPLYFFLSDLESKGQPALREGEDEFLAEQVTEDMALSGRLHLVERALLDKLLEELKLSSTQLVDPQTALRLGKILSARILVSGSILRFDGQLRVTLKAVDTETTRIVAIVMESLNMGEDLPQSVQKLCENLSEKIASAYPVRGRIQKVQEGKVILNIGTEAGVVPGMSMKVAEGEGGEIKLKITEVSDKTSTAVSLVKGVSPRENWRVEEVGG